MGVGVKAAAIKRGTEITPIVVTGGVILVVLLVVYLLLRIGKPLGDLFGKTTEAGANVASGVEKLTEGAVPLGEGGADVLAGGGSVLSGVGAGGKAFGGVLKTFFGQDDPLVTKDEFVRGTPQLVLRIEDKKDTTPGTRKRTRVWLRVTAQGQPVGGAHVRGRYIHNLTGVIHEEPNGFTGPDGRLYLEWTVENRPFRSNEDDVELVAKADGFNPSTTLTVL